MTAASIVHHGVNPLNDSLAKYPASWQPIIHPNRTPCHNYAAGFGTFPEVAAARSTPHAVRNAQVPFSPPPLSFDYPPYTAV